MVTVTAADKKAPGLFRYLRKKSWFSIPVVVIVILLILTGIRYIHRQVKINWAREKALPQMEMLMEEMDYVNAFHLCQLARKYIPDDPEFLELDPQITRWISILTDPPGADIYHKEYGDIEGEWEFLGTTPIDSIRLPNRTFYRWKLEKPGYEVVYTAHTTWWGGALYRTLHEIGKIPEGMVYIEGIYNPVSGDFLYENKLEFFIDKYEVTNKQYKKFIDQGGYENPAFWQNQFKLSNEILSFEEAMEHFKDATGRPGPANWEAGDYPDGEDNFPVNGISWYEADAYAVYAGKSLPTINHWRSAAGFARYDYRNLLGSQVTPLSNMKGIGVDPVGSNSAMNYFGTYDMYGNVREWGWNKSPAGRIIQGGAWNDPVYMLFNVSQLPAFDRSAKNGFRCAIYPDSEQIPEQMFEPVDLGTHVDYTMEEPVSEAEFQILKKQFLYDKRELYSSLEERYQTPVDWIIEKVSFNAAYENERVMAYLFLPKTSKPPFQTIVFFPGGNARHDSTIFKRNAPNYELGYIIKNGRAVMWPIYKGTYERRDGPCNPRPPFHSHQHTECQVKWVKDFCRSVDYLETREDIDTTRLAYLGTSWGGAMGVIFMAIENRLKLGILLKGGLRPVKILPEADPFNYVSHVEIPVLMLNGRYDFIFPYESHVKPMFDLLATPEQDKKLVPYDTDHFIPEAGRVKEVLEWLDKYFGPVQKVSPED